MLECSRKGVGPCMHVEKLLTWKTAGANLILIRLGGLKFNEGGVFCAINDYGRKYRMRCPTPSVLKIELS